MANYVQLKVVIIGAGIGGLATSLAVVNAGHRAIILEQATDFVEVCQPFKTLLPWLLRHDILRVRSVPAFKYPQMHPESLSDGASDLTWKPSHRGPIESTTETGRLASLTDIQT